MKRFSFFVLSFLAACGSESPRVSAVELDAQAAQTGLSSDKLGTWRVTKPVKGPARDSAGAFTYAYKRSQSLSPLEQVRRTKREEVATGRVFELTKLADALASVLDDVAVDDSDPEAPPEGTLVTVYPHSWTHLDCNGDGDSDSSIWDADDRTIISSPSAPRQRTEVSISSTAGGCSGTILRDRWVLTATHCTYTQAGSAAGSYSVRNWAGESVGVSLVFRGPGYNINSFDPEDDYTLLKLNASFPTATGDMDISNISDGNINVVDDRFHNLGFPANINNCTATSSLVHTSNNQITGKSNRTIRWKGDSSGGHSGGALYYCPDDDITGCDSDDKGFVVATVTGFSGWYNRNIGPRGAYFKDWATTIMDNN